jgi:pilus assembly protein Flp/PilA
VKGCAADTFGTTAIEYALVAGLIALVIITAVTQVGIKTATLFTAVSAAP